MCENAQALSVGVELENTGSLCSRAQLPLVCLWVLNAETSGFKTIGLNFEDLPWQRFTFKQNRD